MQGGPGGAQKEAQKASTKASAEKHKKRKSGLAHRDVPGQLSRYNDEMHGSRFPFLMYVFEV